MALAGGNTKLLVSELSLAAQNREIERLRRGEKFISFYCAIEAGKIRTVYLLSLPSGMGCRRCHGRDYWSYGDEPDLYRCARCFPRPARADERDVAFRLAEKHLQNLLSSHVPIQLIVEPGREIVRPIARGSTRDQGDHSMICEASDCFLKVRFYEEPGNDGWWCWKPCPYFKVGAGRAPDSG
jgi:hypothetical protein